MHSYFRQYDQATEGILHLLEGTQLGTNGAKYTHLDTRKHVQEIDEPFYLTLEKRDTVIANLTFCKRDKDWYLRYFAFHQAFQRKKAKAGSTSNNLFKTELNTFFNQQLESEKVHRFYAYIDPKNDRSMAMAQNFGFEKVSEIITQTFSRKRPKASLRLTQEISYNELEPIIEKNFKHLPYFFDAHLKSGNFYCLKSESGEILAFAHVKNTKWRIEQLPGQFGPLLTKLIPYIPVVRSYIQPNGHKFLTVDTVWVNNNEANLTQELFEGILYASKHRILFWWISPSHKLYKKILSALNWGVFDRIIGRNKVDVMNKTQLPVDLINEVYTSSLDFI